MSLADCIKKAGKALNGRDADALKKYTSEGMTDEQAVQALSASIDGELSGIAEQITQAGGTVNETETTPLSDTGELQDGPRVPASEELLAAPVRTGTETDKREQDGSLKGLPREIEGFTPQQWQEAEDLAIAYMEEAGLPYNPPNEYRPINVGRAQDIAAAYEEMVHDPLDPEVAAAYAQLILETTAQYQAIVDSGITIEFMDIEKNGDPYAANPRMVIDDVINNRHMWIYPTRSGFGTAADFDPVNNPLLAETKFEISGQVALANDLFRAVHDYFGHVKEGLGTRAAGEENAWRMHSAMFSPSAQRALTSETRGQNSWLNYGEHAEHNQAAKSEDTIFADQKTGLMPEWTSQDGVDDSTLTLYQSLSSRVPTSVSASENALDEILTLDHDLTLDDPVLLKKNMDKIFATVANMRPLDGTPEQQAEQFITHMTDNLLWLHDHMPSEMRDRAKLWYDGAQKTTVAWADRYGISEMQGAAVIAVLSPQNGWFANMSQAERIIDMVFGLRDTKWDAAMTKTAAKIKGTDGGKYMKMAKGKTLGELLDNADAAAHWIRVYDQTHNNRSYKVLTPEGGTADWSKTAAGNNAVLAWKTFSYISKAVNILMDGRAENVHYQIGAEHKVRNFYNNIFNPNSEKGYVTIDTHAVAAAILQPESSNDVNVLGAFAKGTSSSAKSGVHGTYPLYLEAYTRAADARGILPREMQSITWEAVRGLFEAAKKSKMKPSAEAIWKDYAAGNIEQFEAQQQILKLAGDITAPDWVAVERTEKTERTYEGPPQEAIDARGPYGIEVDGGSIVFEVAPHPDNVGPRALWDSLSEQRQTEVSIAVASVLIPAVLKELSIDGTFGMKLGGFLGKPNPSITLQIKNQELAISSAKLIGYALQQQSMVVITEDATVGNEATEEISITLPDGYGEKQINELYERLWEIEKDGNKLITGHTTDGGVMSILNFNEGLKQGELAHIIDDHLNNEFEVVGALVFTSLQEEEDYNYVSKIPEKRGTFAGESSLERRANNLRRTAEELFYAEANSQVFEQRQTFYSQLEAVVADAQQIKASPAQWIATLKKNGVKDEEIEWTGIEEYMAGQKTVAKEDLLNFAQNNAVIIKDINLGGDFDVMTSETNEEWNDLRQLSRDIGMDDTDIEQLYYDLLSGSDVGTSLATSDEISNMFQELAEDIRGQERELATFGQYTLEGGSNYRELVVTKPSAKNNIYKDEEYQALETKVADRLGLRERLHKIRSLLTLEELADYIDIRNRVNPQPYVDTTHYAGIDNPLLHVRLKDFDSDVGSVLLIEEIQSGLHQQGRKAGYKKDQGPINRDAMSEADLDSFAKNIGFTWNKKSPDSWLSKGLHPDGAVANKNEDGTYTLLTSDDVWFKGSSVIAFGERVPDMPFKGNAWVALGFKKALNEAIINGKDVLAWTGGKEQAERYSLSKQVDSINYRKTENGFDIVAIKNGQSIAERRGVSEKEATELLGKDVVAKMVAEEGAETNVLGESHHTLEGEDLQVGGHGMVNFYDKVLPNVAKKIIKKYGGKVETTVLDNGVEVWSVKITDKMRAIAEEGQPLFQEKKTEIRGYYDPENTLIRLTEASDLSTFLHEFAHFMMDMEMKSESPNMKDINDWFVRNSTEIAIEANGYLNENKREFDQTAFHGGPKDDLTELTTDYMGDGDGTQAYGWGIYLSDSVDVSGQFVGESGKLYRVDIDIENADLMQWDMPISQQPNILKALGIDLDKPDLLPNRITPDMTGQQVYEALSRGLTNRSVTATKKAASEYLYSLGIKGNGYADGNSRLDGRNVQNFVVFNGKDLSISSDTIERVEPITQKEVADVIANGRDADVTPQRYNSIFRAMHEQFARGFETYIIEGHAPNAKLREVFAKFTNWLLQVYNNINGSRLDKVNLDEQMIEVFNRLFTAQETVEESETRLRYAPLFATAEEAGMTEKQFNSYLDAASDSTDKAVETLRNKLVEQLMRQQKDAWVKERDDEMLVQAEIVKDKKVNKARKALLTVMKLDRKEVRGFVGGNVPKNMQNMSVQKGGLQLEMAAAMLDYSSVDQMMDDLVNQPSIQEEALQLADEVMLQRHGDILNDGSIEHLADEAAHNEKRGEALLKELKALSKGKPAIDKAMMKSLAVETIGNIPVVELRPSQYRSAEIRNAQAAAVAHSKGDKELALQHKERQVANFYLWREAVKAKSDASKISRKLQKRYNKKAVRGEIGKAGNGYLEQIDDILGRFDFRVQSKKDSVPLAVIWMAQRNEEGDVLDLSPEVLNPKFAKRWKEMTIAELRGVQDSVENIEHVARLHNMVLNGIDRMNFADAIEQSVAAIEASGPPKYKLMSREDKGFIQGGRTFLAELTKIGFLTSWMDGGDRIGINHMLISAPINDGYAHKARLYDEHVTPLMALMNSRSKADIKRFNSKVTVPELAVGDSDGTYKVSQLFMFAMNMGTESNMRKMILGEKWGDDTTASNPAIQAIINKLEERDFELVQEVWDRMNALYPLLAETNRKATGLTPPKIPAQKLETPWGTLRGGYMPMAYDYSRMDDGGPKLQAKADAQTEYGFGFGGGFDVNISASATQDRTHGFYAPLQINMSVIANHFNEVTHFIALSAAVKSVKRVTENNDFKKAVVSRFGEEHYKLFDGWLKDVAKDGRQSLVLDTSEKIVNYLNLGLTLSIMGFKASTGIIQTSGLSNSIAEVGPARMASALKGIMFSEETMKESWQYAVERSNILAHRMSTMDREIAIAMKSLEGKDGNWKAFQRMSMQHIAYIQTFTVDLPTWHAAYAKGLEEHDGDEAKAIRQADWTVENIQGSGATKDMAALYRNQNPAIKMLHMFMTFFSSLQNTERDAIRSSKSGKDSVWRTMQKFLFMITIPVIYEMIMRGNVDLDDEPEEIIKDLAVGHLAFATSGIPLVRDVINVATTGYDFGPAPLLSTLRYGMGGTMGVLSEGTDSSTGQVQQAAKMAALFTQMPATNQLLASYKHLSDVSEGEEFKVHSLLFGPERDKE